MTAGHLRPGGWRRRHRFAVAAVLLAVAILSVWSVKLALLYDGVGQARAYWSVPRGQQGGLVYVALGDSTAQGVGASTPEKGYVGLLARRLRRSSGRPVRVVNLSVSGTRVMDVLRQQVPALAGLRPDLVTVAVGGNDIRHYDAPRFATETERLLAALPAGSFVADVPYFMHGFWERDAEQAPAVVIRGAQRHRLHPVRLHDALEHGGASAMLTDFAADWFHPDDRGYRVWSDAFWLQVARSEAARGAVRATRTRYGVPESEGYPGPVPVTRAEGDRGPAAPPSGSGL